MAHPKQKETQSLKRPYVKPKLSKVQLRADEQVLGNCKTSGSSGPGNTGNCGTIPCNTIGS